MPEYPIKLGREIKHFDMPVPTSMLERDEAPLKMSYPSVYLEWDKDHELPESGEITFKYRVVRETTERKPSGEDKRQSLELEVLEICGVDAKEDSRDDAEDALDKLAKESEEDSD